MSTLGCWLALAGALGAVSPAAGQFTATILHPPGATQSSALGVSATHQVGSATIGGVQQAAMWAGSSATYISLHPAGAHTSVARRVEGNRQAGWSRSSSSAISARAAMWTGTATSFQYIAPPSSTFPSFIYDLSGNVLCGRLSNDATAWHGNPPVPAPLASDPYGSAAFATDGVRFAGVNTAYMPGTPGFEYFSHAVLWESSSSAPIDLHPVAFGEESFIRGIDGDTQAGYVNAFLGAGPPRACLWQGSAASAVLLHPNLNPSMYEGSELSAAAAGYQCGGFFDYIANPGSQPQAYLWRGTRESATSLQPYLPPAYSGSWAYHMIESGGLLHIVGTAYHTATGAQHAVMWTGLPCYPNCDNSTQQPLLNVSDFGCFLQRFAAGNAYANCDGSTAQPTLNIADFGCFLQKFAAGCSN